MSSRYRFAAPLAVALAMVDVAHAQSNERISVTTLGAEASGDSRNSSISADGRCVAFASSAYDLVPNDTNGERDVFLRDRVLGTTELVSVSIGGAVGNRLSVNPSISADGRFVAFWSSSNNLVAGDNNARDDVFLRDRLLATTARVSVTSAGVESNGHSYAPSISADGRYIAFHSSASNLAGNNGGYYRVLIHDRITSTTVLANPSMAPGQIDGSCWRPSISADGRFVAFESTSSNILPSVWTFEDIYVCDTVTGTIERASIATSGAGGNANETSASISADGNRIAFASGSTDLVAGDTNGTVHIFVRDRVAGTTARLSVSSAGAESDGNSGSPAISADGRFVAFHSYATNLDSVHAGPWSDVFVRDLQNGTTERVSFGMNGALANSGGNDPAISPDGRLVSFWSSATNLVPGDTNGDTDVFLRDRGTLSPTVYCTAGTTSGGCIASITASSNPSLSLASPCTLSVASVEGLKFGLLFYGVDNSSFAPTPWAPGSASWTCVKAPLQRTLAQSSGGSLGACDGSFALDWDAYQASNPSALGNPWSVDAVVFAQAWFRDPPSATTTQLSDAVKMTYVP